MNQLAAFRDSTATGPIRTGESTHEKGGITVNEHLIQLVKRLKYLGYSSFHLQAIVREAIGIDSIKNATQTQHLKVIEALEKYEQLGRTYLQAYSK